MEDEHLDVDQRTRIGRRPERQATDRSALYAILDEALVAHLAVVRDGEPLVVPIACARDGDAVLLHGSTGAGALRLAASGAPVSVAVTLIDGLVVARSAFDNSMNYRSAVIFGTPTVLQGDDKIAALATLTDRLLPDRSAEVRPSTAKELAATLILRLPLDTASVKIRAATASTEPDDGEDRTAWAGVIPLALQPSSAIPTSDVPDGTELPASVTTFIARARSQAVAIRAALEPPEQ
ncbi:hypothetical protein SAMN04489812_3112 [Microlunatus soli]|uniref:Nitroimidazol reductase NimA, pyridoxamine 5'-phosphate oxidase superfamily n=2 Tax=Microlunatus soli TaxID=630515 RepID=A0A1H1V8P1_9ACTN|nr:hypothetical protein SAMN04489812_3112 [Microlunatus soli]